MADLKLEHIYKVYPNGAKAVNDFNLDIENKEFIVFVGPSGCGKSTTLRMIAGLEEITAGDLYIDGKLVNALSPKDRDIAFVFQNYALYPHMTVYDNMSFSLKNQHLPKDEINKRVLEAAKILDIEEYLSRKPKEMSGGQRQRVALGRAIVRNPKVFLLDEPLSNLDAKLRAQMRTEITKLHKKIGTTFIYVTHDQVEAMTMGSRIVVMKDGFIQQIDTPINLYNKPANKFVAGFIGTPQMNFFDVTLKKQDKEVEIKIDDISNFSIPFDIVSKVDKKYLDGEKKIILGCRSEHFKISEKGIPCKITLIEELGNESIIYAQFNLKDDASVIDNKQIILKAPASINYKIGDIIKIQFDLNFIHLFDAETEESILNDIPSINRLDITIKDNKTLIFGKEITLPPVFEKKLKNDEYEILISPSSFVEGNDFSLKVKKCENIGDSYLLTLDNGDYNLFVISKNEHKVRTKYSFSIKFDEITFISNNKTVLNSVSKNLMLNGWFTSKKIKNQENKKDVNYYYQITTDVKLLAPIEKVKKLALTEGKACFKEDFKYVFPNTAIDLAKNDYTLNVLDILDYTNKKYVRVDFFGQVLLIPVSSDFNASKLSFSIDTNQIDIYKVSNDMRIC